jgi:hypothetical protein
MLYGRAATIYGSPQRVVTKNTFAVKFLSRPRRDGEFGASNKRLT